MAVNIEEDEISGIPPHLNPITGGVYDPIGTDPDPGPVMPPRVYPPFVDNVLNVLSGPTGGTPSPPPFPVIDDSVRNVDVVFPHVGDPPMPWDPHVVIGTDKEINWPPPGGGPDRPIFPEGRTDDPPIHFPPPPVPPHTPFWAWDRLESRPRQEDFSKVLKAEIHDPLWMLGRQWQMGEFTGMDSGSGVLARTQVDYQKIDAVNTYKPEYLMSGGPTPDAYSQTAPLEPIVEMISYNWSIKERILMGKKFLQFAYKAMGPDYNTFLPWFRKPASYPYGFILEVAEPTPATPALTDALIIAAADVYSENNVRNFLSAIALSDNGAAAMEHDIDGATVYAHLTTGASITSILSPPSLPIPSAGLTVAENDYIKWVEKAYSIPKNEKWVPSGLEYQFEAYWPKTGTVNHNRLFSRSYHGSHIDWHSFVEDSNYLAPSGIPLPPPPMKFFQQMIMTQNQFPGMPNNRWWEFEDGNVNFGKIDADTTDVAKIILTQFALIYQDDWFLMPCKLPVGSYSDVRGVLVKDVFGVYTLIQNYARNVPMPVSGIINSFVAPTLPIAEWMSWRWLDVSRKNNVVNNVNEPTGSLIITPVANKTMESKPIESVLFMRDEMADLVWAIENIVPDKLGKGKDGFDTVNKFLEYLKKFKSVPDNNIPQPMDDTAKLTYQLEMNPVPENWIPFTPVHISPPATNNRLIHYQRAAMPRIIYDYDNSLVRPRTEILNYGLRSVSAASPPSPPTTGTILFPQSFGLPPQSYAPLYINEEEIPKGGTIVQTTFRRTRWYDGAIINWVGRKRTMGKGEGNSGLAFDTITALNT